MMMRIEWPLRDEHFVLEDATGRAFPIPLKTVTSWDLFEHILQEHFKGRTGAHRVVRRRYMLSERATSMEVDRATTWANAFRPYQRIDMSILCKAPATDVDVDMSSTCPFCGKESTSGMDVQVKWYVFSHFRAHEQSSPNEAKTANRSTEESSISRRMKTP